MAVVALIVDERRGERIVITDEQSLHHHVGPGEVAHVVPDLVIEEPVPSDMLDEIVRRVEEHAAKIRA